MVSETVRPSSPRSGFLYALTAYAWWGFLPLYIVLTAPTSPVELIGWRILCSVVFAALLLCFVRRGWASFGTLVRDPRLVGILLLAGLLVAANWLFYVTAVSTGRTVEGALGYFLNPIVSIVLALVVERERLRPLQWGAVGLAAIAVVVLAVGYGVVPWLAIGCAFSFGLYGLVKKRVGVRVDAVSGLLLETTLIAPLGVACLVIAGALGGLTFGGFGVGHTLVLVASGVVTAVPLLLFASAARRLTLVEIALMQYVAPILQFVVGVWVFHEVMPPERWAGFAIVWAALILFSVDLAIVGRRSRPDAEQPDAG